MKKIGKVLSCFLPFIIAIVMQIGVGIVVGMFYGIIQGVKLGVSGITDPNEIATTITESMTGDFSLVLNIFVGVCCVILFGIWYKRSYVKENKIKLKEVFSGKTLIWITLLGVGLQIGIALLLTLVASLKPEWFKSYNELMKQLGGGSSLLSFVAIVIVAPISEELIFRGVIFEKCKKVMPLLAANILQAVLFGVMHFNIIQGLYAFVLGIFLGVVCTKRKSIVSAIALHMVFNLSGVLLDLVLTNELFNLPIVLVVMFLFSVVITVFSTRKLAKDNIQIIENELIVE
jgi:membrane protease YdiL (CAAX protease family)